MKIVIKGNAALSIQVAFGSGCKSNEISRLIEILNWLKTLKVIWNICSKFHNDKYFKSLLDSV